MSIKSLRVGLLALSGLALALGLGSCGKVEDGGDPALFDSNTNWLLRCRDDQQCSGSLRCYCGICTKPCGQDSECGLLGGAQCAESGESLCGEQASAGGLCVLACKEAVDCGTGFDCNAGQCVPKPCPLPLVPAPDWDQIFQSVNLDLSRADPGDTPYLRYFELGNGSTDSSAAGSCGITLSVKLQALTKLLNSVSIDPIMTSPAPIDLEQHIYRIDVRDYQWDRPTVGAGFSGSDGWETLVQNDPYALSFRGADADDAAATTGTTTPVLLVDSFIAAATQPEVYYGLLRIYQQDQYQQDPPTNFLSGYLLEQLNVQQGAPTAFEAGFIDAGVEFLAEQWELQSRAGFLWLISDVGRGSGALFADPLKAAAGEREMLFTLPNGLPAFAFVGADGQRLDGWSVTGDPAEPDGRARAPRTNLRRHAGKLAIRDEVRAQVEANAARFSPSDLALIRQRFPGSDALALQLSNDDDAFNRPALTALGIDPDAPDPILEAFAEFERPVTLEVAAAELMLSPKDLRKNLALLDPRLAALDGGSVPRDVFTSLYTQSACQLSVVLENQPDSHFCP